jgi:hypothetical protein
MCRGGCAVVGGLHDGGMLLSPGSTLVPSPVPLLRQRDGDAAGLRLREDDRRVRVRPGVYAPRDHWEGLKPWERYVARVHAFALVSPGVVFCLESAAALLGLPLFGEPRDIHVFDATRERSHRFGDVAVHTSADARIVSTGALSVTSAADTTVDLIRVLPPACGLAVGDAALRAFPRTVDTKLLSEIADSQVNGRGSRRLRWALPRLDARSESVSESVSRAVIEWSGFPEPELQRVFHYEGFEDRSDFFWTAYRAIGESDGYDKYTDDPQEAARRIRAEKQREDRLRRHVNGFARWDYAGATRVTPLCTALMRAGVPQLAPPQRALLATLRHNPRSR